MNNDYYELFYLFVKQQSHYINLNEKIQNVKNVCHPSNFPDGQCQNFKIQQLGQGIQTGNF